MPLHSVPFSVSENRRIYHHQPDLRSTDFDRVEDIGADALGAAREALLAIEALPYPLFKPIQSQTRALRDAVLDRKVLNDRFRDTVVDLQRALAGAEVDEGSHAAVEQIIKRLREALRASHRVSDLLAAEQEIGFHRGIGR